MTKAWDKARGERAIFRVFARAAGLPIRWPSIRSRPVPEPDIRCTVIGRGPVAFELGEVVYSRFAETTYQRQSLRRRFAGAYATLPAPIRSQLEQRLGGPPAVFISFPGGTSPGTWQRVISLILAVLHLRGGGRRRGSPASPVSPGDGPGTARSRGRRRGSASSAPAGPPCSCAGLAVKARVQGGESEASRA